MNIQKMTKENRAQVKSFFEAHWGSAEMVISSGVYACDTLDGFIYEEQGEIIGLITYIIKQNELEIISLDSVKEGSGIGSQLLQQVEKFASSEGIQYITLVTTNDNLHAFRFYQKRGYRMVEIYRNAVEYARKIKPSIPAVGNNGIPILDEIKFVKKI